jgi:hypothetical protein
MLTDPRIPLVFGSLDSAGPDDAVLFEGRQRPYAGAATHFTPGTGHAIGCSCCVARQEAGRALTWLLHARARNQVPYFTRVLAVVETEQGRAEVQAALRTDPVASGCFR